jgi:uncharacterized protein DUF3501
MEKLAVDDVLPLDAYLEQRDPLRAEARAAKARRRVQVGDRISLMFENRATVLHQIHEMVRVENVRDQVKIAEEVRVYNDLIAGADELRATFFVEITDRDRIKDDLDSLVGLEREGLFLVVDGARIAAEFEPGHAREDRISAVHYLRFVLAREQLAALLGGQSRVEVVIEHPRYSARAELGKATLSALAEDLGDRPAAAIAG